MHINVPEQEVFIVPNIDILEPKPSEGWIRSIPDLIEYNATQNGDLTFCVQALKKGPDNYELYSVTHRQLKQAALQCSYWLKENVKELVLPKQVGDQVVKGKPIALLAESDLGLLLHEFALLHLGVPVVLLSARLSPAALAHLLKATSAAAIITSARLQDLPTKSGAQVATYVQQPFFEFLDKCTDNESDSFGSKGHYTHDRDRNVIILHSSGSTGLPKPIYHGHRYLLGFTKAHLFGSQEEAQNLTLSTLPLFHAYGFIGPALSLGIGQPLCLPPSSIVPSASSTVSLLKSTGARTMITVPSILEDMAALPGDQGISALEPLGYVAFGGGPLKKHVGDQLASNGVKLLQHYGATEVGPLAPIFCPPVTNNWEYFRLRRDMGLSLASTGTTAESARQFSLTAHPFGWDKDFQLQDVLEEDPANEGWDFRSRGRTDDVIPLATGEKVNPRILESRLREVPGVRSAIAFGESRFEIGVMIEQIDTNTYDTEDFRQNIWLAIENANKEMDEHGRIFSPEAILIVQPGKALPRTDKGSIMRKEAYKAFEAEIEQIYFLLETTSRIDNLVLLNMATLEADITKLIQENLEFKPSEKDLGLHDDFFELGMDSLKAVRLGRLLKWSLNASSDFGKEESDAISKDFVYRFPTISSLASALRGSSHAADAEDATSLLERHLKTYASSKLSSDFKSVNRPATVLVTGCSGSLGSHIIAHLTSLPHVTRVICVNRSSKFGESTDPYERQRKACQSRLINMSDDSWSKLEVIETDCSQTYLGLSEADYSKICSQVTHILHNAWPLNFKWSLRSFSSQFDVLQNLIQLAKDAHSLKKFRRPRLIFVSSIAVVGNFPEVYGTRLIPEVVIEDTRCIDDFGYSQAKLICERMIEKASSLYTDQIEVASVRMGQMATARGTGYWSSTEHIAALVKSSQAIGAFPSLAGTLSWLPVDCAAEALSDVLFTQDLPSLIFHIENPIRQSWSDVTATLMSGLNMAKGSTLPYSEWLQSVVSYGQRFPDQVPVVKLHDFFERDFKRMACGEVVLDTAKARSCSLSLAKSDSMPAADILATIEYWKSIGFV